MEPFKDGREFLKAHSWERHRAFESDQRKGVRMPPVQKQAGEGDTLVSLVDPEMLSVGNTPVLQIIRQRRSRRSFTDESLSLEELSYLLWATQGLRDSYVEGRPSFRTVPSAGARHPFETYLSIHRVDGLQPGLYRYLPLDHKLCLLRVDDQLPEKVADGARGFRRQGRGCVHLDRNPVQNGMAVWACIAQGHCNGCGTPLPESLHRSRVDWLRHMRDRCIQPDQG